MAFLLEVEKMTNSITIILNGKPSLVSAQLSVAELVMQLNLAQQRIAVELNQMILPRSQYEQTHLKSQDQLEIVTAIGGG